MKNILFFIFIILIVLIFSEVILRVIGHKPGIFTNYDNFNTVDSLYTFKNYQTDEYGIYKFSSYVTDSLRIEFDNNPQFTKREMIDMGIDPMDGINNIYSEFKLLQLKIEGKEISSKYHKEQLNSAEWKTPFPQLAEKLLKKKQGDNNWERLIGQYVYKPFNREGFRSIAFDTTAEKAIRILLLGDSFAYGMSAYPFFNSYADILLSRGYIIYNTGISGVDPAQYAAVAKKYVPLLKPDLVILNFYPGNDLMPFPREANKDEPHEHMTNAGFFQSSPEGKYLNPQEAYSYYLSLVSIPETNTFNYISSKSSILTIIWGILHKNNWVEHPVLNNYNQLHYNVSKSQKAQLTSKYISDIMNVCKTNKTDLLNTVVPSKEVLINKNTIVEDSILQIVFSNNKYYYPENLNPSDYIAGDDFHFSNPGALKYADFLDSLIQMQYIQSEK
ncbi:MAG: SGNH/GDSL hydrolase family protein [Chitinophagales bacterium]